MKNQEMYIVRKETVTTEESTPALAMIRHLPLTRILPVFEDCTIDELQYFLSRATAQEEYELCKHLKDLIELRYSYCVA